MSNLGVNSKDGRVSVSATSTGQMTKTSRPLLSVSQAAARWPACDSVAEKTGGGDLPDLPFCVL